MPSIKYWNGSTWVILAKPPEDIRIDQSIALVVEVRADDPATPAVGRIWLRSDL